MPECKCGKIPANIKVIKIGESEVGIPDLQRIMRDVYFNKLSSESRIKEEILNRVAEKIFIPEERKEMYASALFEEYGRFVLRWERREKARAGEQGRSQWKKKDNGQWPFNFLKRKDKK
jgi:hypothetical protein